MIIFRRKRRRSLTIEEQLTKAYNHHRFRWIRRFFYCSITIILLGSGTIGYVFYHYTRDLPSLSTIFKSSATIQKKLQRGSIVYLNDRGQSFYKVKTVSYTPISKNDVKHATNVTKALIATEDRQFYREQGVNWTRTIKAGLGTYLHHEVAGGSTLTQQLIKLLYFSTSRKDQTVKRKVQEIVLAQQLSKKYSKLQILTWYLNRVNFGNSQQGIVAAAHYYYDKTPRQLTKLEAATLVGIVNSPAMYNPYVHPNLMKQRRRDVLLSMVATKAITKAQFKRWVNLPITSTLVSKRRHLKRIQNDLATRLRYDGFIMAANRQLNRYGLNAQTKNLVVKTTMNESLQDQVDAIIDHADFSDSHMQEGLVVLNNQNGQVVAMSGGRNTSQIGGYNRAIDLNRSSGSSIKPLLDYGPGFDLFGWNSNTTVYDTPYDYPNSNAAVHDWDNQYQGAISLHSALVQSRNIPAVKALSQVGLTNGQNALLALGLSNGRLYYSNAIGVNTSPLRMASAYSSLADNGYRANARFVQQVQNMDNGKQIHTKPVFERVFTRQTSVKMSHILQDVFYGNGTATRAKISDSNQAGKTGTVGRNNTSDALTDAWMIGYTKSYTVAVWVGYDNPYSKQILTNEKAYVAQDIYRNVMKKVMKLDNNTNSDWHLSKDSSTKDTFLNATNRQTANLPFYIDQSPDQFFGINQIQPLESIYRKVEND